MSDLLEQAMRRTIELVNVVNPVLILSDAKIKELVNSAYESICLKLANQGVTNLRKEVIVLGVPPLTTTLSESTNPSIPAMFAPVRLWERPQNGTTWTFMNKVIDHIPVNATAGASLIRWEWRDGTLNFIGATNPTDLKIHYVPRQSTLAMPGDAFAYPDLINPVSFVAASLGLGGNPFYEDKAEKELYAIMSIDAHTQQSVPVRLRRRRFGSRRF